MKCKDVECNFCGFINGFLFSGGRNSSDIVRVCFWFFFFIGYGRVVVEK